MEKKIKKSAVKTVSSPKKSVKKAVKKAAPLKKAVAKKTTTVAKKKALTKRDKVALPKSPTKARVKVQIEDSKLTKLHDTIIDGLLNKKAQNIVSIDLRHIPDAVANFFIICEGEATTQIRAIADSVEELVRLKLNDRPWHVEGMANMDWIIVDYVNVVVHIFKGEVRKFYQLEELWSDGIVKQY